MSVCLCVTDDDCRVVLQPVPVHGHRASIEHNDYINASYIDVSPHTMPFVMVDIVALVYFTCCIFRTRGVQRVENSLQHKVCAIVVNLNL